jgi:predicted acyltransferase
MKKSCTLFVAANACLVLGIIMNIWFPINKPLWTSSYVVFMAGMALHVLALCMWLIDVKGVQRWAKPFIVFGSNAIAVFALSSMVARILVMIQVYSGGQRVSLKFYLYETVFASWAGPLNGSLGFAVGTVLFWLGLMAVLYRKRIFIKV